MASKMVDRLKAAQESYQQSQTVYDTQFGGVKVDEGEYYARLSKAFFKESRAGNLMICREHIILTGEYEGCPVFDRLMIDGENIDPINNLKWARRWIDLIEMTAPDELIEWEDMLEEAVEQKITVKIRIRHSGDFVNVDVLERVDMSEEQEPVSEPPNEEPPESKPEPKSKKEEKGKKEKEDLIPALTEFCKAWQIKTKGLKTQEDFTEAIKADMQENEYSEDQIDDEEKELLEKIGLTDFIS